MKQASQAQKFVWVRNIPNELSLFFILLFKYAVYVVLMFYA